MPAATSSAPRPLPESAFFAGEAGSGDGVWPGTEAVKGAGNLRGTFTSMKQEDSQPLFSLTVPPAGRNGPGPMAGPSDSELLSDVARIRRVLARELETINEYEAFAQSSSNPEVRAFFAHLAAEEKEHVAEATQMLRLLDSAQDTHFTNPIAPGHYQKAIGGPPGPSPTQSPEPSNNGPAGGRPVVEPVSTLPPHRVIYGLTAPPSQNAYPLTVGSLRRPGGGGSGRGGSR